MGWQARAQIGAHHFNDPSGIGKIIIGLLNRLPFVGKSLLLLNRLPIGRGIGEDIPTAFDTGRGRSEAESSRRR